MRNFKYSDADAGEIRKLFNTDADYVSVLEDIADRYLRIVSLGSIDNVQRLIRSLETVKRHLSSDDDALHRERLTIEIGELKKSLPFLDKPRDKKARKHHLFVAFNIWIIGHPGSARWYNELKLSVSETPLHRFVEEALMPVWKAAGEEISVGRAINEFLASKKTKALVL